MNGSITNTFGEMRGWGVREVAHCSCSAAVGIAKVTTSSTTFIGHFH